MARTTPFRFKSGAITAEVDGAIYIKKAQNYLANLKRQVTLPPGTSESVIDELVNIVLAKAPSPEEEVMMILYGTQGESSVYGSNAIRPKPNKKGSISTFLVPGRVRYIKTGMHIREAIIADKEKSRITDDGNFIGFALGNISFLNENTKFSYINATKGSDRKAPKTYGPFKTPYGMFLAFEYGTQALGWGAVTPKRGKHLTPTDDIKVTDMVKTIKPYNMYSQINKQLVKDIIQNKIRQVQFE